MENLDALNRKKNRHKIVCYVKDCFTHSKGKSQHQETKSIIAHY